MINLPNVQLMMVSSITYGPGESIYQLKGQRRSTGRGIGVLILD